jgi:hypothetical protein
MLTENAVIPADLLLPFHLAVLMFRIQAALFAGMDPIACPQLLCCPPGFQIHALHSECVGIP